MADSLVVFVPTKLVNLKNERSHWTVKARRTKTQREAMALEVYYALNCADYFSGKPWQQTAGLKGAWKITAKPTTPKRVTFTAHVARKFDDDSLPITMSPFRDGLQDCGLIHSDGPDSGHDFIYKQVVAKPTGVEIRVELV